MSCSVGEPLANNPAQCLVGAFGIVHAEGVSIVMPKIELGEVTVQVFLTDVLINAVDAALQNREEVLGTLVEASPRTYSCCA
jgi:hypothetical protein